MGWSVEGKEGEALCAVEGSGFIAAFLVVCRWLSVFWFSFSFCVSSVGWYDSGTGIISYRRLLELAWLGWWFVVVVIMGAHSVT